MRTVENETRYMVIAYLPYGCRRFQLEGPVLVETRDYIHFYLTGTRLAVETVAYVTLDEFPLGITEQGATELFLACFNDLLRVTMEYENSDWSKAPQCHCSVPRLSPNLYSELITREAWL